MSLSQLRRKWEQGIRNGVPGLELLTGGVAEAMEPMLAPCVAGALYAPTTGTVNPWQLGIAAFEKAAANGMDPMLGTTVVGIRKPKFGYLVETDRSELRCRAVINCAGLSAERLRFRQAPPRQREPRATLSWREPPCTDRTNVWKATHARCI